jgi:hypothetical protein
MSIPTLTSAASNCPAEWPEVDPSRIVRPERIITPTVSGLSIPVRLEMPDRIERQWQVYLLHLDGRREHRLLDEIIDLGESNRLFVHPLPGQPSDSLSSGWSGESRRAWLQGEAAAHPAELFARICSQIAMFIDLPTGRAAGITATLALWTLLTYVYPAWPAVPYLFVGGPAGSGKSRVFEVLSRLTFRPLVSSNLTAASLFRTLSVANIFIDCEIYST